MRGGCGWFLLLLVGCDPGVHLLAVDMRSDLLPGREFTQIEVSLDDGEPIVIDADPEADYLDGVRLQEWPMVEAGPHRILVRLVLWESLVLERPLSVDLDNDSVFTVQLTRDCRGVECADGGVCLASMCVEETCSEQTPDGCGAAECASPADCTEAPACGSARCEAGTCLYVGDGAMCAPLNFCDLDRGCRDDSINQGSWTLDANDDALFFAFAIRNEGRVDGQLFTPTGTSDLFIQAREPDNSSVRWTRQFGGGGLLWPHDSAITANGALLIGGVAKSPDVFAPLTLEGVTGHDGFLAVFDPSNGDPLWAIGVTEESDYVDVISVAASPDGFLFALIVLRTEVTVGTLTITPTRETDYALVAFIPAGPDTWVESWVTPITAGRPSRIAAGMSSVYVAGLADDTVTIGGTTATGGDKNGFVGMVSIGGTVNWVTLLGEGKDSVMRDVTVDVNGRAHAVGAQSSGTATYGTVMVDVASPEDVVLVGLAPDGTVAYATAFGGAGRDHGYQIQHARTSPFVTWAGVSAAPFDYAGGTLGDAARGDSLVWGAADLDGAPIRGGTLPSMTSDGPWRRPDGFTTTSADRVCAVGRAPAEYADAIFVGAERIHLSCSSLSMP